MKERQLVKLAHLLNRAVSLRMEKWVIRALWNVGKRQFHEDNIATRKAYFIELIEHEAEAELNSLNQGRTP
jgi:hypothetical protein